MTFLQLLGIAALTVVLLCVLLLLALRYALPWWIKRKLLANLGAAELVTPVAARVRLQRQKLQWQQEGMPALVQALKQAGYQSAGRYEVDALPFMQLWAGTHADGSFAVAYDHPQLPPWFDLARRNRQGVHAGVSTSLVPDPAFIPDEWNILHNASLTPRQAHEALHQLALPGEPLPIQPRSFAKAYEIMYAMSADHALAGPPPTLQAMLDKSARLARAIGKPPPAPTPEQQNIALEHQRLTWRSALDEALLDHFLHSGALSAVEFEQVRDTVCIVHERLTQEEVIDIALRASPLHAPNPAMAQALEACRSADARFDAIQNLLPPSQRLRLLGQVSRPLPARIYDSRPAYAPDEDEQDDSPLPAPEQA